ncbi:MAG: hypothetical protein ABIH76_05480 [Candidatus Bathyarchaeota archaeon]
MKYMMGAMILGLAKELRDNGIGCETVTKLMLGNEDSRNSICDPDIVVFLRKENGTISLITADTEIAKYCQKLNIPCIRIQDVVINFVKKTESDRD